MPITLERRLRHLLKWYLLYLPRVLLRLAGNAWASATCAAGAFRAVGFPPRSMSSAEIVGASAHRLIKLWLTRNRVCVGKEILHFGLSGGQGLSARTSLCHRSHRKDVDENINIEDIDERDYSYDMVICRTSWSMLTTTAGLCGNVSVCGLGDCVVHVR